MNQENKSKTRLATEQQFVHNLIQCIEVFPQYTIAQHLIHILRKKGAEKDPYRWDDEFTLKRIEKYYDELSEDLVNEPDTDEDDDY